MGDLVNQPTSEPTRKTIAVGMGGVSAVSISVVIGWVCRTFLHQEMPGEVQVALASILIFACSYLTRERVSV